MAIGNSEDAEQVTFSEKHFDGGDVLFGDDGPLTQADQIADGQHDRDDR